MTETKICSKCGIEKELALFYNRKVAKDGKTSECKSCAAANKQKYYTDNIDMLKIKHKEYRDTHKESVQIRHVKWIKENPNYHKEYHAKHPEVGQKNSHKQHAKRRCWGNPIPINQPFEGAHLHHTHLNNDHQACIYIPAELHESARHAYNKPETMDKINKLAFEWLATCESI